MPFFSTRAKNGRYFYARSLRPSDMEGFRKVRIESLRFYGSIFDAFVSHELMQPDSYWVDQSTEKRDFSFHGLFDEEGTLVGLQGARTYEEDPTGKTALWWGSYVCDTARGIGATRVLYQSREQWCLDHGYERAKAYVLYRCKRSAEILCKRGAKHISHELMAFHGGPLASWNWYEIPLVKGKKQIVRTENCTNNFHLYSPSKECKKPSVPRIA